MGTGDKLLGVTLRWTSIPSRGGVAILLVASCYRNRAKLRPCGPLRLSCDFTFTFPSMIPDPGFRAFFSICLFLQVEFNPENRWCLKYTWVTTNDHEWEWEKLFNRKWTVFGHLNRSKFDTEDGSERREGEGCGVEWSKSTSSRCL